MSKATIARIERVTHRYGKTFALNDLTLDIPAQCMAGLIGPDGVGKSTLLALISGVRKIQTGKVTVLDGNMADEQPSQGELWPHCLHAAGAWPQSLSDAQRFRQYRLLRPAVRPGRDRAARAHRRASEGHRARSVSGPTMRQAFRRHEAESQPLLLADARSRSPRSRRAHHGRRSAFAPAVLGADRFNPRCVGRT